MELSDRDCADERLYHIVTQCCHCRLYKASDGSWQINPAEIDNQNISHGLCGDCEQVYLEELAEFESSLQRGADALLSAKQCG